MTHPRIYHAGDMQAGSCYQLATEDRKYLTTVLRLQAGDAILLFNGSGREAEGVLDLRQEKDLFVKVLKTWAVSPENLSITIAQALPKSGKMDMILQKATELGAHRIVPFLSNRSVPRLDRDKASVRLDRWRKIVAEAARQCRRAYIPDVSPVLGFDDMLSQAADGSLRMIFWEDETGTDIKMVLRRDQKGEKKECFMIIGPEGGFTADEITAAKNLGFQSVSLGRHVLRTETVALTVTAIIQYQMGHFFDLAEGRES